MKSFYNDRKIPIISPLLINDKLETDFKKNPHHFNLFFASKCIPLINNSVLPDPVDYISTARLSSINFNNVDILKTIKSLNVNKAHGYNDISIRMIKLCGQSIVKLLSIIFKNCIDNGIFPDIWKKPNIIPVHKKVTNKSLIIIDLFFFYEFVVKFSKNYYSTQYLNFLMIIIFLIGLRSSREKQSRF